MWVFCNFCITMEKYMSTTYSDLFLKYCWSVVLAFQIWLLQYTMTFIKWGASIFISVRLGLKIIFDQPNGASSCFNATLQYNREWPWQLRWWNINLCVWEFYVCKINNWCQISVKFSRCLNETGAIVSSCRSHFLAHITWWMFAPPQWQSFRVLAFS